MNLRVISKKIQHTRLFSDAQKVTLLAMLPDSSEGDIRKLEDGIDTFDREYREAIEKRSDEIMGLLKNIMKDMPKEEKKKHQEAIDEIVMGVALLQPTA